MAAASKSTFFELRKFVIPEIVFGEGALDLSGQFVRNLGSTCALIVTDPGVTEFGWSARVGQSLAHAGVHFDVYDAITPNPKDHEIMAGAHIYKHCCCDIIVAVGGGSVIDCAKGIGLVASSGHHISDFEGVDLVETPGPPLLCVPTTAGTGSDVSQFAVISDVERRLKFGIVSKLVIPDVALVDPVATTSMPSQLTAATGFDVLSHTFEAFVSTASSPLTDLEALEAVRLTKRYLKQAYTAPLDFEARGQMSMASLRAGLAFSNASLGLVHAMAHALGGRVDVAHGDCNAILLEHVVAFNFAHASARYRLLGEAMGLNLTGDRDSVVCDKIVSALQQLRQQLGIASSLREVGVQHDDVKAMAPNASNDACLVTNPVLATTVEIEELYERAL